LWTLRHSSLERDKKVLLAINVQIQLGQKP
jgi:hypothetical protein